MSQDLVLREVSSSMKIKAQFMRTVDYIRQYNGKISQLKRDIHQRNAKVKDMQAEINAKSNQLNGILIYNQILQKQLQNIETKLQLLEQDHQTQKSDLEQKIKAKDSQLGNLIERLKEKEEENHILRKQDNMSLDQSTVSMREFTQQSFALQISEVFKNSPGEIYKFLDSIEGDKPEDPKELGDMTCMFVSKDGLSLQKYIWVNRTFLKRKIKETQKIFRFVLIHKPDK